MEDQQNDQDDLLNPFVDSDGGTAIDDNFTAGEEPIKLLLRHSELSENEFMTLVMKKNSIKFKSELKPANLHKVFLNTGCDVSYETGRKIFLTTKASRKRKPTSHLCSL